MKRAAILLAFLFLGCKPEPVETAENLTCGTRIIEGRKFAVCRSYVYGGAVVAMQPLEVCK